VTDCLTADGHEVIIFAPAPGPDCYGRTLVVRVASRELRWYPSFPVAVGVRGLVNLLRDFDPDVVHLASPIALGAAGVVAARRLDIPTVAVYQTDLPRFAERYGHKWVSSTLQRFIKWVHNQATLTLVPSTAAAKDLAALGVGPLRLWGRGVDLDLFHPDKASCSLRRSWSPDGKLIVGYVGRLAPEKEVRLLSHIASVPEIKLVVVGDGPDADGLRRLLPDAHFTGFLGGEPLASAFASFDVFVHTGRAETFGQTIQEALASGVPALVPAAGGPRDLVRHWHNGWLWDPEAPAQMRTVMDRVVAARQHLSEVSRRARRSVAHRHWIGITDELLDHYFEGIALNAREEAA
jgi:phosphatidylinositol alpha 1,6-mannosyltransferase